MSGSITFQPYGTNTPQSTFLSQTQGYVQGTALDDPSARMWLAGGVLASTESDPMWGGVPIEEIVNLAGASADGLGPTIKRATSQSTLTGWSVYNQANSMVITPGNTAPLAAVGNFVAFFRTGTNQRIAVQCDPALIAAIASGVAINSQALYWDVTNYRITLTTSGGNWALPTSTRLLSANTNSKIVTYSGGVASWVAGDAAIILI